MADVLALQALQADADDITDDPALIEIVDRVLGVGD